MTLSVLIPVYNEKNTISEILRKIDEVDLKNLGFNKEIIIVDDGSNDGTADILKTLEGKYKIIYRSKNQGKGAAIRTGLKEVSGDYLIIQDADLEYDPKDYNILLRPFLEDNAQVVYGSRILGSKKHGSLAYYWGGLGVTLATNIICGIKITDEPTCYKVFKRDLLNSLNLQCRGFEFCPEVTAKIARRKIKIFEVPISYNPRGKQEGKKINWKDGFVAIWTLLKYRFWYN